MKLAGLYWRTIRHLRPRQIAGRLANRLPRPAPAHRLAPPLRAPEGKWVVPITRPASVLGQDRFAFLNREMALDFPAGWNDASLPKLWLYNLHYFDQLGGVFDPGEVETNLALAKRWIDDNPAAHGNGWEPYPLSLRIVNWLKFALSHGALPATLAESLAVQIRALEHRIEWHILANHLFANAKALVFAGLCHTGPEADRWLSKGLRILERELSEQVLSDGGHFERSPMYHAIILEDVLDLLNVGRTHPGLSGVQSGAWQAIAGRMLGWLSAMTHPDGEIAFFNDCALGIAPNLAELSAYAGRLGIERTGPDRTMIDMPASGYVRADAGAFSLIFDIAPIGPDYQPGHAHADTLSFELSAGDRRIFVNSGVSTYEANAVRGAERATAAHNTVEVDQESSSEVWSAFRVARRARITQRSVKCLDGKATLEGAHDGYSRNRKAIITHRTIEMTSDRIVISDRIEGVHRSAVSRLRLSPGLAAVIDADGMGGVLSDAGQPLLRWSSTSPGRLVAIEHALAFNRREPTLEIQIALQAGSVSVELRSLERPTAA